jgi:hypothetical protein
LSFNVGARPSSEAVALLDDPADLYDFLLQFKELAQPLVRHTHRETAK